MQLNRKGWKTYFFWILLSEAVGMLSGALSRDGMLSFLDSAAQSPLSPPPILFPFVWTALYALMGVGMAQVARYGKRSEISKAQRLFLTQLAVNFLWPLIFFNAQAYGFALLWLLLLWMLVLAMALEFGEQYRSAGLLQIPYLLWLTFAAYLNFTVWRLNM